jgi:hypothetical protein
MTSQAIAPLGRGRPTVESLLGSLDRARQVNGDLRLELRAQRHEERVFARRILHSSRELRRAIILGRWDVVDHQANALGYHAARRIQQIGSVVL